jgi:uncharacterized damage-inducible protein DinB
MKKAMTLTLVLLLTAGCVVRAGTPPSAKKQAQGSAAQGAGAQDKTPPSYDMKPQAVLDLQQLQEKYVGLARAIPADKFTWRPAEGVRSVSELFLHVSGANYGFPTMMTGTTPSPGYKQEGFEKSTTEKAQVIEQLNKSFAYAIASVQAMSNADFAKPEKKLGPDANDGDVIYLMVVHSHEHLGQSIAYAREMGIVPPWTAAAAAKKDAKAAQE